MHEITLLRFLSLVGSHCLSSHHLAIGHPITRLGSLFALLGFRSRQQPPPLTDKMPKKILQVFAAKQSQAAPFANLVKPSACKADM